MLYVARSSAQVSIWHTILLSYRSDLGKEILLLYGNKKTPETSKALNQGSTAEANEDSAAEAN